MPESDGDLQQAREVCIALIRQAHAGARRRSAIDFRAAADIQDLWKHLLATRWASDQAVRSDEDP